MLAPVLGAVCLANGTRARTLTVAGVEVLKQPGGTGYGVETSSVSVDEAAPGAVSSMQFVIDDPAKAVTVNSGDMVRFWDHVRDVPIFTGFVDTVTYAPAFATGRTLAVSCVGLDAVLDWLAVPAVLITNTGLISEGEVLQSLVAQSAGVGVPLNTGSSSVSGSQSKPLGTGYAVSSIATWRAPAGSSVRSAFMAFLAAANAADNTSNNAMSPVSRHMTVDAWGGLRYWADQPWTALTAGYYPSDYATLTVTDTAASAVTSSSLAHVVDGGSVIRNVWVTGGNAAGTGSVSDGTGIVGRSQSVSDSAILTDAAKRAAAAGVFASTSEPVRGSMTLESYTPTSVHVGSPLALADAMVGVASTYAVTGLSRTFENGTKETWAVSYGTPEPSYIDGA